VCAREEGGWGHTHIQTKTMKSERARNIEKGERKSAHACARKGGGWKMCARESERKEDLAEEERFEEGGREID